MTTDTQKEKHKSTGLRWHFARQVISAAVFFTLIYGMHCSDNPNLNNCAASIGRALRHDADLAGSVENITAQIKEAFTPDSPAENPPEGITFQ